MGDKTKLLRSKVETALKDLQARTNAMEEARREQLKHCDDSTPVCSEPPSPDREKKLERIARDQAVEWKIYLNAKQDKEKAEKEYLARKKELEDFLDKKRGRSPLVHSLVQKVARLKEKFG